MTCGCPVSRRALLGAALALPALASTDLDAPSAAGRIRNTRDRSFAVTKWDRALQGFRRGERALAAVAHTEDDNIYDRMLGRFNSALRRLVRTKAPDLRAFSVKLDLAVDHEVATLTGGELCMAALKRDARRLARPAAP